MKVSSPAWKLPRVDFPNSWGRVRTPRVKHHESETLKSLIRPSDVAAARDVRPSVCLINYRCKVRKWSSNRNISSAGGWKSKYRGWYCFKSVRRRANSTRIHIRKDKKSQSDCWYVIKKAYLTRGNHQDYMILIGHHVDEAVRGPLQEHQTDEDPKLLHHAGSYKSDGTGSKARQRAGRSRSDKHLTTSSRSKFPFTLSLCSTRTRACSSTRLRDDKKHILQKDEDVYKIPTALNAPYLHLVKTQIFCVGSRGLTWRFKCLGWEN